MAIEKQFKVRYGLSVGNDLVTVDGATGDIVTSGDISANTMSVTTAPTATNDVATKGYVDTAVSSGVGFSGDYNDLTNVPSFATVATSGSYTDLTNKPTLFSGAYTDLTGKPTLFSGSYTDLTNKPTIPNAQIQSDWTQTVNTSLDYIKNKPTLFSGAYTDLTGKPTLFDGAYASLTGKPTFATVATSGSYTDLTNKPTIPSLTGYATETYVNTAVSNLVDTAPTTLDTLNELAAALGDDANFSTTITTALGLKANTSSLSTVATTGAYSDLTGKPTLFSGAYTDLTGKPTLFSGSYTDLTNKPTIPNAQIQSDWTQTVNTSLDYIKNKPTLFSGAYTDLTGKPTLFSGSYTDLTNKPTLFDGAYASLTGKPTSITSFGITDGTAGQVLTTNGTGTFTFTTVTSGLTETDVTKVFVSVRNAEGSTITKGQVVYLYGATGDNPTVKLADSDSDLTSSKTLGVVYDTSITNGSIGYVITQGLITGVNTNAYAAGDSLYLGQTAGTLTNTKPVAPVHSVFVGIVVKVNTNAGQIYIKPQNGYELDELHNVNLTTTAPTNGQVLTYNSSTDVWTAQSPFSGSYTDLTSKPTLFSGAYSDLTGKPTLFSGAYADLTGKPSLATVATSGSYTDLTSKPTLFDGAYASLTGKPTLFDGAYASLTGKPTSITSFGITDGTNGQVLTTNGSGTFTFTTVSGGSGTGETFSPFLLAGM